jgi:hypothetical protein
VVALSGAAQAENLVKTWQSADGGVTQYIDMDKIERNGDLVEIGRVFDYKAPYVRKVNRKPYTSQRVLTEFDCESGAMRQLQFTWHAEDQGKGEILYESKEAEQWEFSKKDTFTMPLWIIACGR